MKGTLKIMGTSGHDSLEWDTEAPQTVETAKGKFLALVMGGFLGFVKTSDGTTTLNEFNPEAQEIVMTPPLAGG